MKLQPSQGGFLRPFGCGEFIRDYLSGQGPHGSSVIDPSRGATQADINSEYRKALAGATARDRAEKIIDRMVRAHQEVSEAEAEEILQRQLRPLSAKTHSMRYHSFLMYFGVLKKLGWVQPTGEIERSALQDYYEDAPSRMYYCLTGAGMGASDDQWRNPLTTLYPHLGVSHNLR